MNYFKKSFSFFLSGILLVSASVYPTADAVYTDLQLVKPKNYSTLRTCCKYDYSYAKYYDNGYKAVYDIHVKVDSEGFKIGQAPQLYQQSSEYITGISSILDNGDGSYIYADVVGFEPAQFDYLTLEFPQNGEYKTVVDASTDVSTDFYLNVKNAVLSCNSSDKTPPQLTVTLPEVLKYNPAKGITVNIKSNEMCYIEIDGNKYNNMCNGVNYKVHSDGVYKISATDINGNPTEMSFTVDIINKLTTTTTTKTTTTTTTKKVTTTTTTTTTTPQTKVVYGDANVDGKVSISDAAAIFQFLGNPDKYYLSAEALKNADCFEPGSGITVNDAIAVQQYDAKIITILP